MSILCSICQESLTARPEFLCPEHDLGSVALRCGHMFHDACVREWFTGSGLRNLQTESRVKDCPCCKKQTCLRDAIKIYPTCDEEEAESTPGARSRETTSQVEDLTRMLAEKQAELNREIEAHDDLKIKYAESLSKTDELQSRLDEAVEKQRLDQAVENSIKTALKDMEKRTEREVGELRRRIKELEEALGRKNEENDLTIVQELDRIQLSPIKSLEPDRRETRLHVTTVPESDEDDEEEDDDDVSPVFSSTRVFAM